MKNGVLIIWTNPHGLPINCEYSQELCQTMNDLGLCEHIPHFLSSEVWPPNVELSSHQVPAKIFPAFSQFQKDWFCGKARLDGFYPLLRSIASTWVHIDVKRICQACCLHHLKNMEKIVKHNFGMKNKVRRFFLGHHVVLFWRRYKTLFSNINVS